MGGDRFFDREVSWVEFNARVLDEALQPDRPLLERLKFLTIVSSNFDEFFMVRVAALKRSLWALRSSGVEETLHRLQGRVREIVDRQTRCLEQDVLPALCEAGLARARMADLSAADARTLADRFTREILPVLTPVRVPADGDFPLVTSLRLHLLVRLEPLAPGGEAPLAVVQIPPGPERVCWLGQGTRPVSFILLEEVILAMAGSLFPGHAVRDAVVFRVARDADLSVDEEQDMDFLEAMSEILVKRRWSLPVRLEMARGADPDLRRTLESRLALSPADVYEIAGPLDVAGLADLVSLPGFEDLRDPPWKPVVPVELQGEDRIWDVLRRGDLLLHHPYESFDPIVRLLEEAAEDPAVMAVKMTLYRTSGDSPVIRALERAANRGKQVAVLVELKARFDEARNIGWAERLERAGGIVIYGVAGLKVHAKALLIVRKEEDGVRRYLHLGTGNYNDRTARQYTDLGLLTCDEQLTFDASLFFNAITGYSTVPGLRQLIMAPLALKAKILELVRREAERGAPGRPGRIVAKLNNLCEPDVIEELYAASRAGVEIQLIIRGICTLVPGVPGLSENIRVIGAIDRFLEHSRILWFRNGGADEVYLGSADWMPRNLERRVELVFPVLQDDLRRRLMTVLETHLADNTRAHLLLPDGRYRRLAPAGREKPSHAQAALYEQARLRSEPAEPRREFVVRRKPPS